MLITEALPPCNRVGGMKGSVGLAEKQLIMEKMSEEAENALQKFKNTWVGKRVKIIGINHPHRGESGECADVEYTNAGWGIRIILENGEGCFVFKGTDIRLDPIFK